MMTSTKVEEAGLAEAETGDLLAERQRLDALVAGLRRVNTQRTREKARERLSVSMLELESAILAKRYDLRHQLATSPAPVPPSLLAELAALVAARDVEALLHEDIDRDARRGESEPFTDDADVSRRRDLEQRLDRVAAELELRTMDGEDGKRDERRKGLLGRIGGAR